MELKILQLIGFCLGGILVAIICNTLLLRFSQSLGIRNKNDVVVRWSNQSKPSLGGVSFFVVFIFTAVGYSMVYDNENIFHNKEYIGLFLAGSMAFAMGLADDAYNTRPYFKMVIQILCGLTLVFTGTYIQLSDNLYVDGLLTVFWVILIMNSLNMLDNMDGITGTTVFFILLTCLLTGWMLLEFNVNIWSILLISVIGSIIGFLTMNIHPSKLFMGDAGSQFIGLFVAFFGVKFLWNIGTETQTTSVFGILVTLVAFTPAAVDTLTVVINRLKRGQSPMVGGKDHTTHHLVYAGLTDKKVWYVFLTIGFISFILSIAMVRLIQVKAEIPVYFVPLYSAFVFFLLYRNTLKHPAPR